MSNFFKKLAEEQKAAYLQHVCEHIQNRRKLGTPITPQEMDGLYPMNSYERHHLMPLFDDDLLLQDLEYSLKHIARSQEKYIEHCLPSPPTYDESVLSLYLPMLIERFKKLKGES